MSQCPKCTCFLKNPNVCSICGHVIKVVDKKKYSIPKKSKKRQEVIDSDIEFFKSIWNERPHISEVSGEHLGEFDPCYFSHVLAKGAYPRFRHYKKNIVLCTFEEHQVWEFSDRKDKEIEWIVLLESRLKQEYYKLNKPFNL